MLSTCRNRGLVIVAVDSVLIICACGGSVGHSGGLVAEHGVRAGLGRVRRRRGVPSPNHQRGPHFSGTLLRLRAHRHWYVAVIRSESGVSCLGASHQEVICAGKKMSTPISQKGILPPPPRRIAAERYPSALQTRRR